MNYGIENSQIDRKSLETSEVKEMFYGGGVVGTAYGNPAQETRLPNCSGISSKENTSTFKGSDIEE